MRTWRGLSLSFDDTAEYRIRREDGVDDARVRSGMRALPRADGSIPGAVFADSRTIVLRLEWFAASAAECEALTAKLRSVTNRSADLHRYSIIRPDGTEVFVWARPLRRDIPDELRRAHHGYVARANLVLEAPDPRLYSPQMISVLVDEFSVGGGGFTWPVVWPITMTAGSQVLGVADNDGNEPAYPLIRFQYPAGGSGSATGFRLRNLSNGDELEIVTALVAGQALTADMDAFARATAGSPIHIAGASRYADWQPPRTALRIDPGTNLLRFDLTGDAPVVCRVDWRHTYL